MENLKKVAISENDPKIDEITRDFEDISTLDNQGIDPSCIFSVENRLVRILYPGIVNNVDKAIENLGGIKSIEKAVSNPSSKLQLNYHPSNKFNKGCLADCDSSSGLLLKIKVDTPKDGPVKYNYEIEGITVRNFTFNKLIDFQYLPLVSEFPETADSQVDYILDKILPKNLPSLSSILSDEQANMPLFLTPVGYSRTDTQRKFTPFRKTDENNAPPKPITHKLLRKRFTLSEDRASKFHKFTEPEVPTEPSEYVCHFLSTRDYTDQIEKLQKFFSERPIWTKNGIKCNTNFSNDILKLLLPAVAYYATTGPWRSTWIRFGYDPRKDPEARKFQNLDYRLPSSVRTNLKIGPKKNTFRSEVINLQKLQPATAGVKRLKPTENTYILRPNMLPQSRQVFYQYCDILLPEIQTMLARLPPVPPSTQCDAKNGWFPTSFIDQCREIVNKYIDEQATTELRKYQQTAADAGSSDKSAPKSTDLTSLMMKNVKRGLHKPFDHSEAGPSTSQESLETMSVTEIIDSDNEDPTFPEEFEDIEWDIQDQNVDDLIINPDDIDIDALEDVKKILGNTSKSP